MDMGSAEIIKRLKSAGWELDRVKGSHHQLRHPDGSKVVTVPHPKKDLPLGLVRAIEKATGVNLR